MIFLHEHVDTNWLVIETAKLVWFNSLSSRGPRYVNGNHYTVHMEDERDGKIRKILKF